MANIWRPRPFPNYPRLRGHRPPRAGVSSAFPLRAAFYYPWFTVGGDAGMPGAWTQQGFSPWTQYQPKLHTTGPLAFYDSGAQATMDNHIDAMEWGNFDVVIWSWWGQTSRENNILDEFLARLVALGSTLKVAIYHEGEGNVVGEMAGSPDPTIAQITSDLNYIESNFANHPNYLWVGGKPVIFAYGDAGDGAQATEDLRPPKRWFLGNAAAIQPFYTVLKVYANWDTLDMAFQPDSWHQYGPDTAFDQQGTKSVTISPGFWLSYEVTPRLHRDIARWAENVTAMLAASVDWKLVTSFNEFGEGHPVENVDGATVNNSPSQNGHYTGTGWDSASGYGEYLDVLHNNGAPPNLAARGVPAGQHGQVLHRQWLAT